MNPKLEVYQIISEQNNTYLVYRYKDDHNNNYEYQIYKLVQSRAVAREMGVSEERENGETPLNTREMCDQMIKNLER